MSIKGHEKSVRFGSLPYAGLCRAWSHLPSLCSLPAHKSIGYSQSHERHARSVAVLAACSYCSETPQPARTLLFLSCFLQDPPNFRNGFALRPHLFDPGNPVYRLLPRVPAREPAFFLPKREKAFFRIEFQCAVPDSRKADQLPDGNRF